MHKSTLKRILKSVGITKHPVDGRALSSHKYIELLKLYNKHCK